MDADLAYLTQNARLFRAVLDFNRFYQPPEFGLAGAEAQTTRLRTALAANPRAWRRFAGEHTDVWCFAAAANRLALLPLEVLERLAGYWNAVVLAEVLARTVDGARLQQIKAVIGADAFQYAVRQGRFQLGSLRQDWLPAEAERLSERALQAPGQKLIQLCLGLWPEALRRAWQNRWRSAPWVESFALSAPLAAAEKTQVHQVLWQKTWPHVEKLLLTEVAPQWQPCFSS
ncbi:hypothetical protein FACS1894116_05920 [Betaproteobacteria bacterium]|nr:hypothetical protein FACS1894116_05920 [Betaproteobacteria bacterium]GHT98319.1 hypothetical protein FACS1894154_03430 [Betaproteobacteria bacterium]GHU23375.1 hypothetical protein FACS189488_05800 [Betaproteobacteria bacterium]